MEHPRSNPGLRAWAILLVCVAVALAVYPFQPFTGSLALVVLLALVVGTALVAAGAFRRA